MIARKTRAVVKATGIRTAPAGVHGKCCMGGRKALRLIDAAVVEPCMGGRLVGYADDRFWSARCREEDMRRD